MAPHELERFGQSINNSISNTIHSGLVLDTENRRYTSGIVNVKLATTNFETLLT
jgi:hypothetical protein